MLGLPASLFDDDQIRLLSDKINEMMSVEDGTWEMIEGSVKKMLEQQLERKKPALQRALVEKTLKALQTHLDRVIEARLVAHTNALFDQIEEKVAATIKSLPPPPRAVAAPASASAAASFSSVSGPMPSPAALLEACLFQRDATVLIDFCARTNASAVFGTTVAPGVLLSLAQQLTLFLGSCSADERAAVALRWLLHASETLSQQTAQETVARFWPTIQQRLRVTVVERLADRAFAVLSPNLVVLLQQLGA